MKLRIYIIGVVLSLGMAIQAEVWRTHFAYNNVTQIAMSNDKVYAISDGSLYSVNKQSEQIRVYNRQSGLHETGITCIHYDSEGQQLIIAYGNGKIDILHPDGVQYIGELYDKDMTQRKTIYNVTIHGRTAYLSTHYGVQTMDLREGKLVDSYWLRPGGEETPVKDIVIANDSIYAFTDDSLFCASMKASLVDYRVWRREVRSGRIAPEEEKGRHFSDGNSEWYAGWAEGIVRFTATDRIAYKPQGPLANKPYRMTVSQGKLWVVPGGRWAAQDNTSGMVMTYENGQWTNISTAAIEAKTNLPALDFMNIAVDPRNKNHYYVTSYGTGLYEFDHDTLVRHDIAGGDNTLISAVASNPERYTRLDFASYDRDGNLWLQNAGMREQLQCRASDNSWHSNTIVVNNKNVESRTPGGLVIDRRNPHHKWFAVARVSTSLGLLDDKGTWENDDDEAVNYVSWIDQNGHTYAPSFIYGIMQDSRGRLWMGTEQGAAYIDSKTDYFHSNDIILPEVTDNNGENPITTQPINAFCETSEGQIWVGSNGLGVYVLNGSSLELIAHYTTDNSAMPSNSILSLAGDESGKVWVGTANGLVEYDPYGSPEGLNGTSGDGESGLEEGSMKQWKLHLCYSNPHEIAASANRIYAASDGALFSIDRTDYTMDYWNKSTGLNGNSVTHIAFDQRSQKLVIAYGDGRIDLMSEDGTVAQMPDLYMKASSVSVVINCLAVGSRAVYAGTSFGIIAINPRKAEFTDTYYIGEGASSVDVHTIIEYGDTLYAFSKDMIYKACLMDNLVDYSYWEREPVPGTGIQQAAVWHNELYTLQHDSLYRHTNSGWQLVLPDAFEWMSSNDGQLLLRCINKGLFRLTDGDKTEGLCDRYAMNCALYTNGEYWIGETEWGLVKLETEGDLYFHTEGPNSNFGYSLTAAHGRIYSTIGGRWASEFLRYAKCNVYDGSYWSGYNYMDFLNSVGELILDPVGIAVDRNDAGRFYMATYGTGLIEFRNFTPYKHYTSSNSTLRPVNSSVSADFYTRVESPWIDEQGYLWVMNATKIGKPLHVLTPSGQWVGLSLRSGGTDITFSTPSGLCPDKRNSQYKWMLDQRATPGVILFYDGGTPLNNTDDHCLKRNSFTDQNGNTLTPSFFYCMAQDHTNRMWIGTEKGILVLPAETDFFSSNECKRIIIPRNDGTGLGDYLLGDEQIKCMAVDGGNRMWIGTAGSGLYLIEDDTITVAHFTENNSLLPSSSILSITIMPETGEVFVGTDKGIASYRSDASEAHETMDGAYAYPNPVRPDYGGYISITGLMDNSEVRIVDSGGNLICKTRSHGGTAVWDGKRPDGQRATPGIYTALCNATGGHTAVKIMIIR